jgi:hypothetical protein
MKLNTSIASSLVVDAGLILDAAPPFRCDKSLVCIFGVDELPRG